MKCEFCRFWSELIARSVALPLGRLDVEAFCLCPVSQHFQTYTLKMGGCAEGQPGAAVDDPDAAA